MNIGQPQSESLGGTFLTIHNADHVLTYLAQQAEGAAHVGEFNQPFRDYVALGLGLGGTDHPANVNTIQGRVAALEYNLANGGSLSGIAGADHSSYLGSIAIAGAQFAAPSYSNAPNLLGGSLLDPAEITYAELSPAATPSSGNYSPAWTNAYSDVSGKDTATINAPTTPSFEGRYNQYSSTFLPFGGALAIGGTSAISHEISTPSFNMEHGVEISRSNTAEKTIFLGESSTVDMHLNLSPDVQERLAGISNTMRNYNLSGGAVSTSSVSMPDVPNMAPVREAPSRAYVI
jgi:hypothetical protein